MAVVTQCTGNVVAIDKNRNREPVAMMAIDRSSYRRLYIGLGLSLVALSAIIAIAATALRGVALFNRYPITPSMLGYGAIAVGASCYIFYFMQSKELLRCTGFLPFLQVATFMNLLIIGGALAVSGHLSLIQSAKMVCSIAAIAIVPFFNVSMFFCIRETLD